MFTISKVGVYFLMSSLDKREVLYSCNPVLMMLIVCLKGAKNPRHGDQRHRASDGALQPL